MEEGIGGMLAALREQSKGMITNRDLMEQFNSAAMLVSKDFAQNLPNAMGYLSKVSAATGQDMDFMMSSLITGVGRLSPMILDNLGIQVDMTAAMEKWADANGKAVKEMTKTEQQMALMDQVMEKLRINTDDMPDITENAATKMAQFQTSIANLKDAVGMALLPIFTKLMSGLTGFANKIAPWVYSAFLNLADIIETLGKYFGFVLDEGDALNDWLTHLPKPIRGIVKFFGKLIVGIQGLLQAFQRGGLGEIFTTFEDGSNIIGRFLSDVLGIPEEIGYAIGNVVNQIAGFIGRLVESGQVFIQWLQSTGDPIWALQMAIANLFGPEVANQFENIRQQIGLFIDKVLEVTEPIRTWIKENVKLQDILTTIGIFLGVTLLSIIAGVIAALAPIILLVGGIILAVALVRKAWETNWNGIRDKAAAVVEWVKTELVPWFKEKTTRRTTSLLMAWLRWSCMAT